MTSTSVKTKALRLSRASIHKIIQTRTAKNQRNLDYGGVFIIQVDINCSDNTLNRIINV